MANWYHYPQTGRAATLINLDYVAQIQKGKEGSNYGGDYPFYILFTFTGVAGDYAGKQQMTFVGNWKTEESRDQEWDALVARTVAAGMSPKPNA